jgi:hypothetical protein
MDYVHACSFCGWSRAAATPVVLPAGCPDCGCPADSEPRVEHERRALAAIAPGGLELPRAARIAMVVFALLFASAFARVGYATFGVAGAITAVGTSGFLLLPFVPERL